MGKYQIIYADPPWMHNDKAASGERGAGFKYNLLSLGQLMAMRDYIDSLTAPDCLLAMWWVGPMPEEALLLLKAWGFSLKTMKGFSWHKVTKNGKDFLGMGNWTRCNTEDCMFAVRGRPKRISASVRQFIESEIREHSRKPDEARDRLVELMGDVPRIELFARERFRGWDAMGDELPPLSDDHLALNALERQAERGFGRADAEAELKDPYAVLEALAPELRQWTHDRPADAEASEERIAESQIELERAAAIDEMIAGQAILEDLAACEVAMNSPDMGMPKFASGTREDEYRVGAYMEMPEGEE